MNTYTKVTKPVGTVYSNAIPTGFERYDQSTVMYDDTGTFYDGTNYSLYTKISKPAFTTTNAGMSMGLLMPLTRKVTTTTSPWTKVTKPN